MDMKQIAVDVDVNRAIEAERRTFAESPNDILRRILLGQAAAVKPNTAPAPMVAVSELDMPRFGARMMGHWQAKLADAVVSASSLKEAYCRFIVLANQHDREFLERFALLKGKTRRYIARRPEDLYLKSPHLAKDYAVALVPGWYIDSNLSESQISQRVGEAARELGLVYGKDAWVRDATRTI